MKLNFLKLLKQKLLNRTRKAFSLNDLSVLMSTIAIVAVSAVAISNIQNVDKQEKADSQKIEVIYKAIGIFLLKISVYHVRQVLQKFVVRIQVTE